MTTKTLKERPRLRRYDKWPMPARLERAYGRSDDEALTRTQSAMSLDPDLDRWVNEGGAHCDRPTFTRHLSKPKHFLLNHFFG
jgi:hypothetical protein